MGSGLSVVRDLREARRPASPEELADYETDLLAGFVLARSSAGLSDGTIRGEVSNLEQVREWFGRPLWEMEPADADAYFGKVMRQAASGTRPARAGALVHLLRVPGAAPPGRAARADRPGGDLPGR